jgi:hypothetical protein
MPQASVMHYQRVQIQESETRRSPDRTVPNGIPQAIRALRARPLYV